MDGHIAGESLENRNKEVSGKRRDNNTLITNGVCSAFFNGWTLARHFGRTTHK
jgi:hypothetical protein